jgi:hypothetical protein
LVFAIKQSLELNEYKRFVEHLYFVLRGEKDRSTLAFDDPLMKYIIEQLREKDLLN